MSIFTRFTNRGRRTDHVDNESPQVVFDPARHVEVTDALRHGSIADLVDMLLGQNVLPFEKVSDRIRRINALRGDVSLRVAGGYHADDALLVYSDDYTVAELAELFNAAVGNNFVMESAPGSSNGGDDKAIAIISRGHDYDAFCDNGGRLGINVQHVPLGTPGYFKDHIRPDLDVMSFVLASVLAVVDKTKHTAALTVSS